ncbi:Transposase IS30-like HTH domain containing protein [Actinobacteria bacterium OK006]|nr:Transposase IS30-like HTH domain containing protein [Actinobacteria bacterium OK006]
MAVGVSWPVGSRWFRHAGGMPPISLDEPTGRYLSFAEREEIALLRAQEIGVREIARRIGRDPGTISRELRRNAATRSGKSVYRALVAQWKAQQAAKRPKTAKLVGNDRLREYVQDRLAGSVRRPDGMIVTGPETRAWKGLNKPHRQDRRWAMAWSPEQISHRLGADFPDDESMRISHEATPGGRSQRIEPPPIPERFNADDTGAPTTPTEARSATSTPSQPPTRGPRNTTMTPKSGNSTSR